MLKAILLVSIGGAVGSSMRYLTSVFMHKWVSQLYPWGTFIANTLGCFLIGIIMGYIAKIQLNSDEVSFRPRELRDYSEPVLRRSIQLVDNA